MFFVHLFLPHSSNNHRPKILHNQSLLFLILFLLVFGFSLNFIKVRNPEVLGAATNISSEKLVQLTNEERVKNNLPPLNADKELSEAAREKAKDMFSKNYWAHNGPDGKTPWTFILDSGYQYIYAGENLARDFNKTEDVIRAWMKSPGHKANILSVNYQDIGFAVVSGKLNGQETTLVIQLFGARKEGTMAKLIPTSAQVFGAQEEIKTPLFDSQFLVRNLAIAILGFLILVLTIDMIIVQRKKIVRLAGHNLDHIIFLGGLAAAILIVRGGLIL